MMYRGIKGVPDFACLEFAPKRQRYAVLIPVINEGERIRHELQRMKRTCIAGCADIVLCDGGSTDGSMEATALTRLTVNTLLIKRGAGKQGAQLRMGIWWALRRGYEGIVTIDGNDKDGVAQIPDFLAKLEEGYGFVQGSRFVKGGKAINTPLVRLIALQWIHAPIISLTAGHRFTDTTNAYRAYAAAYLKDSRVKPLRDIFSSYELLAYLSVRASQLGYRVCEIPVTRAYPKQGKTPTKISAWKGNTELLKILFKNALGAYQPKKKEV